eukprot:GHVU01073682.1.p1 GENE.GHVU01073682.1~~GHVU01073682.1.p1  ORF type:complete len:140 (+),score=13.71 GHVU01073682.1:183-602(+)
MCRSPAGMVRGPMREGLLLKVCGLRDQDAVFAAADARADIVGLVFAPVAPPPPCPTSTVFVFLFLPPYSPPPRLRPTVPRPTGAASQGVLLLLLHTKKRNPNSLWRSTCACVPACLPAYAEECRSRSVTSHRLTRHVYS